MSTDSPDFSVTQLSADESLLLQQLRAGDPHAVAAVERRYADELRLFCARMLRDPALGDDVVQDVLATCCALRADSLPQASIRGWLYQVARRKCIDVMRRGGGSRPQNKSSFSRAIDPVTTPAGKIARRDSANRLLAALDQLDEELRSVVIMRYFQELPREAIAEALGLTLAGTKSRLARGLAALRKELSDLDLSQLRLS